jgi:thiamine biosynthesis protein ThiS
VSIAITVNGAPREVGERTSVAALLDELELEPERTAVERNGRIVRRAAHGETTLEPGDALEIVTLVGGG